LRDLSDEEFEATAAEIQAGSDRVAGILGAAVMQNALIGAILSRLKDTTDAPKLFDDRGPMNSLSSQIMMGRALGLYNGRVEDMMHIVRKVRNKFAHSVVSLDFSDPQIASWCNELKSFAAEPMPNRTISDARRFYEDGCYHFTATVLRVVNDDLLRKANALKRKAQLLGAAEGNHLGKLGLGGLLNLIGPGFEDSD
jgi:hypothetical protein